MATLAKRLKDGIKFLARSAGLDLERTTTVPFGVRWEDDAWSLMHPQNRESPVLIDVGANVGQTALKMLRRFPHAQIFCFEPVDSSFASLIRNTAPHRQIRCFNIALGDVAGEGHITTDRGCMNTFAQSTPSQTSASVRIDTVDLFCDEKIAKIDLLKIDTEGFETSVLNGASGMFDSSRVDFVVCECDFFPRDSQPHGNFFEIFRFLTNRGFRVVSFYTGGVDRDGWVWGDVLMVRNDALRGHWLRTSPFTQV